MGDVTPLRTVHPDDAANDAPRLYCRRPGCGRVVREVERGRPPIFCSPECQKKFPRDRAKAERFLSHAQQAFAQFHPESSDMDQKSPVPATGRTTSTERTWDRSTRADDALSLLAHEVEIAITRLTLDTPDVTQVAADLTAAKRAAYRRLLDD
jgi:hypothetical protein